MSFTILAASYSNDVYTITFENNSLTLKSSVQVGFHPSWIAFHPEDKSLVFTGLEQDEGKIVAIKYDGDGKGSIVAQSSSGGKGPCSLVAVKDELLIANVSDIYFIHLFLMLSSVPSTLVDQSLFFRCRKTRPTSLRNQLPRRLS